jgi:YD repeat-containing protein
MLTKDGHTTSLDVTEFWDGKPVEADHFGIGGDGGLVPGGHSTWLYDAQGRQQYVIRQPGGPGGNFSREVERTVYDANGRPYFVDQSDYSPDVMSVYLHNFTFRSWFANGVLAHELDTCDVDYGPSCDMLEQRWEPCGNLAYVASRTSWGRFGSSADWSWGAAGRPLKSHVRWNDLGGRVFDSTESYQVDHDGRLVSGTILNVNPPGAFFPLPEQQVDSYRYDDEGHLIERSLDGNTVFHARFDAAGRLIELGTGSDIVRWTYDGCGR